MSTICPECKKAVMGYQIEKCPFCGHNLKELSEEELYYANFIKETKALKETRHPIVNCPFCRSTDCKKISGASKVGKVALFGVFAAGSVSKTWHCNNCGSNFG